MKNFSIAIEITKIIISSNKNLKKEEIIYILKQLLEENLSFDTLDTPAFQIAKTYAINNNDVTLDTFLYIFKNINQTLKDKQIEIENNYFKG